MEFVCYSDWGQLPESANALFAKGEKESVFFSRLWFENLTNNALNDDQVMLLACVVEENCVLAILPLMKRTSESWSSLSNIYSSLYTLLLAEKNQQDVLSCLAHGLSELPFKTLRLEPVAENDRNINKLQWAMESFGFYCHRSFHFFNWIYRLQDQSFKDYMAARPARVRNTLARKQRKLEREHGYDIRLFTGGNLEQALADYNAIYRVSWKGHELFGGFIESLLGKLSEPGWLRLAILYIQGQPVAAQLWFVVHGKASIFRLAYDEAWKHYSPGSILTSYLMEHVIDTDKVGEIDFLMGNDRYKQEWMSVCRKRWRLVCVNKHKPKGKVYLFLAWLKDLFRRLKGQVV